MYDHIYIYIYIYINIYIYIYIYILLIFASLGYILILPLLPISENTADAGVVSAVDVVEPWQQKPMERWTSDDILDWIYVVAGCSSVNLSSFKGENFQDLDGRKLCCMSRTDFIARDEEHGEMLFDAMWQLLDRSSKSGAGDRSTCDPSSSEENMVDKRCKFLSHLLWISVFVRQ